MVKAVLYLFLFIILITLVRSVVAVIGKAIGGLTTPETPARGHGSATPTTGELKRDPVCGTYISAETSIKRTVDGKVIHFCSAECSRKYGQA